MKHSLSLASSLGPVLSCSCMPATLPDRPVRDAAPEGRIFVPRCGLVAIIVGPRTGEDGLGPPTEPPVNPPESGRSRTPRPPL